MPKSRSELEKLAALVKERYEKAFGEEMPSLALLSYMESRYYEMQKDLFERMTGHLAPDDIVQFKDVLNPPFVAPPEPPKNVVNIKNKVARSPKVA